MWTEALDAKLRVAVSGAIPAGSVEDGLQAARLAILGSDTGKLDSWYVKKGLWAARDYAKREGLEPVVSAEREIERLDEEGFLSTDGFSRRRRPHRDWKLWRRAVSSMAGYTGHRGGGRMQGVCDCGRGHYRPEGPCPECVLGERV